MLHAPIVVAPPAVRRAVGRDVLAETVAAVDASEPKRSVVAGRPSGAGWIRLDHLLDGDHLDAMAAALLAGRAAGRRNVAGSFLARDLSGTLVMPVSDALLRQGRAWRLDPSSLAVHQAAGDGAVDGIAVLDPTVLVLPGDRAAGAPGTRVVDGPEALRATVAEDAVVLLEQVFAAVRPRGAFGVRGMWGTVADDVAGKAARTALLVHGADAAGVERRYTEAMAFVDEIARRAPMLRRRPRLTAVTWSGGVAPWSIKGTCCLRFRAVPGDGGFCKACPLRRPEEQRALLAAHLEGQAPGLPHGGQIDVASVEASGAGVPDAPPLPEP